MILYRSSDFANRPGAILVWRSVERVRELTTTMRLQLPNPAASSGTETRNQKRIPARLSQTWVLQHVARGTRPIHRAD